MAESYLQKKSKSLLAASKWLCDKCFYSSVGHSAYYSCYQMMLHIWLHKMKKSMADLKQLCKDHKCGSHKILINQVTNHIKTLEKKDGSKFNNNILQLKQLRTNADYEDADFPPSSGEKALELAHLLLPILERYQ